MFNRFGFRAHRFFQKGGFKYLILDLLKEKPHYGYEIMRALEEKSHGFYMPSPGVVYPTLQMLEEMGYVSSAEQDGKKVYTITENGLSYLNEQEKAAEEARSNMGRWHDPEMHQKIHGIMHDLRGTGRVIMEHGRDIDVDKLGKIEEVISHAHQEIEKILEKS